MSLREGPARLLADPRSTEPRARLSQALGRTDFLVRVVRRLATVQNSVRGVEALVDLLLDDLVEIAQVVVHQDDHDLVAMGTHTEGVRSVTAHRGSAVPPGLARVMALGRADEVVVPRGGRERERIISSFVADDGLAGALDEFRVEILLVLPLESRGQVFGAVLLARERGRGFSGSRPFLTDVADRISLGLGTLLAGDETRKMLHRLTRSLAPREFHQVPGLVTATYFCPSSRGAGVGGDFFALHGRAHDLTVLCGDVSGTGVEAAIMAKRIENSVRTARHLGRDPAWLLALVNEVLVDDAPEPSEQFATAVCLRVRTDPDGTRPAQVELASAAHPPALLLRANGDVETLPASGLPLGVDASVRYPTVALTLAHDETLLLNTDGVTEARRPGGRRFGNERLHRTLSQMAGAPAGAIADAVAVAVSEHVGDGPHDDIALVVLQPSRPS